MGGKEKETYIGEFSGRHNSWKMGTIDQMDIVVQGMNGKRVRYQNLIV